MIMRRITYFTWRIASLVLISTTMPAVAEGPDSTIVPQTWQMLDYLATDYAGAVKDGAVSTPSE